MKEQPHLHHFHQYHHHHPLKMSHSNVDHLVILATYTKSLMLIRLMFHLPHNILEILQILTLIPNKLQHQAEEISPQSSQKNYLQMTIKDGKDFYSYLRFQLKFS